jgi:hypothetical protein
MRSVISFCCRCRAHLLYRLLYVIPFCCQLQSTAAKIRTVNNVQTFDSVPRLVNLGNYLANPLCLSGRGICIRSTLTPRLFCSAVRLHLMAENKKKKPSELFLPGRSTFVFALDDDFGEIPTTKSKSVEDLPPQARDPPFFRPIYTNS